jgi:hypothetical protein
MMGSERVSAYGLLAFLKRRDFQNTVIHAIENAKPSEQT